MKACGFCGGMIQRKISIQFIFSSQRVEEQRMCPECTQKFERLAGKITCPGCNRKRAEARMCTDCQKWLKAYPNFSPKHQAVFLYNEMAREYMSRFKFQGDVVLANVFKDVLIKELKMKSQTHLLVPIPLSPLGKEVRGFNQVEVFLREANIPYHPLLIHKGEGKKQSSKSKGERLHTPQPFELKEKGELLGEQPIVIVDDVYTTGRTIYHARNLLEAMGTTSSFSLFR